MPGHGAWTCCRPTWTSSWAKSAPQACLAAPTRSLHCLHRMLPLQDNDYTSPPVQAWACSIMSAGCVDVAFVCMSLWRYSWRACDWPEGCVESPLCMTPVCESRPKDDEQGSGGKIIAGMPNSPTNGSHGTNGTSDRKASRQGICPRATQPYIHSGVASSSMLLPERALCNCFLMTELLHTAVS